MNIVYQGRPYLLFPPVTAPTGLDVIYRGMPIGPANAEGSSSQSDSVTEQSTATDTYSVRKHGVDTVSETVSATDVVSGSFRTLVHVSESATASDTTQAKLRATRDIVEDVALEDLVGYLVIHSHASAARTLVFPTQGRVLVATARGRSLTIPSADRILVPPTDKD